MKLRDKNIGVLALNVINWLIRVSSIILLNFT